MNSNTLSSRWAGFLVAALLLGESPLGAQKETARLPSEPVAEKRADQTASPPHPFGLTEAGEERLPPTPPAPPQFEGGCPPAPPPDAERRPHPHPGSKKEERRGGHHRGGLEGGDEMEVLDSLLSMPPEKLARVRQALERIEAMTAKEREALRDRLRRFQSISPEKREKIREEWKRMSPEERREQIRELRERRWEEVLEEKEPEDVRTRD